jgi:hypothetical protein
LYCEHDPVNSLDPSGHNRLWDWIKSLFGRGPKPPKPPSPPRLPPAQQGGEYPSAGRRVLMNAGEEYPENVRGICGRPGGGGAGPGGIVTIGIGAGLGADIVRRGIRWRRATEAYLDGDGEWPISHD